MRLPAAIVLACLPASAAAIQPDASAPLKDGADPAQHCPQTAAERARSKGERLMPRKLTELPQATEYKAVWRHVGGCEVPLTAVEYRRARTGTAPRP